jgi:hypothetical protein
MTNTSVCNLRYTPMEPGDIRIDRQTEFGNEFIIGRHGTRADVISRFERAERQRLANDPVRRDKVKHMFGHRLFCWCAPKPCHGDVYVCLAAELNSEEPSS